MDKEMFLKNYDIKTDKEKRIIQVKKKNSDDRYKKIPRVNKPFYFSFIGEAKATNIEDAEKMVQEGRAIKATGKELYFSFLDYDEEKWFIDNNGYDFKTKKYLDGVENNIGLLEMKTGHESENINIIKQYDIWANLTGSGKVDIGKKDDNKYIAQYCFRTGIDDYINIILYFNHLPTKKDIMTAEKLREIKSFFSSNNFPCKYICWECNQETHLVDNNGEGINEKFEFFKDSYCGC
ncbi:MAG: hypothetical protein ACOCRX_10585 [Candidatus Woesearchaeota archaeon]